MLCSYAVALASMPLLGWNNWQSTDTVCYMTIVLPQIYLEVIVVGHIYLILLIITILYVIIFHTVRKQKKKIADLSLQSNMSESKRRAFSSDVKTVFSLGIVVISFAVCYAPYCIIFHIIFRDDPTDMDKYLNIMNIGTALAMLNSALNPIIYATRMKQFRKAFKAIICCDKDVHLDQ